MTSIRILAVAAAAAAYSSALAADTLAVYDPAFQVPVCAAEGSGCSSGDLLVSRGWMAVRGETNAPNATQGCWDTTGGTYQVDGSIEAIRIRTVDGSTLAWGKRVVIEVDAWISQDQPEYDQIYVGYDEDPIGVSLHGWTQVMASQNATGVTPGLRTFSFDFGLRKPRLHTDGTVVVLAKLRVGLKREAVRPIYSPGSYCGIDTDELMFVVAPGIDAVPPSLALVSPVDGATVSGDVPLEVIASDDEFLDKVSFYVDGGTVAPQVDFFAPYAGTWQTGLLVGPHVVYATATDAYGNVTTTPPITVNVQDFTGPALSFYVPRQDMLVGGGHPVITQSSDASGVAGVDLYAQRDGMGPETFVGTGVPDLGGYATVAWDTTVGPDGRWQLRAVARDMLGNASEQRIVVTVDNTPPTVVVTSPKDGATLSRRDIGISASVVDANLSAGVGITVDGTPLNTTAGKNSTYSAVWSAKTAAPGAHTITVTAGDTVNRVDRSITVYLK